MKLLVSCVNTLVSLIGVDLEQGEAFWYCPSDRIRACGAAYDKANRALLLASDNALTRIGADGRLTRIALPGPYENLAHSVHPLAGMGIGVADTGNSRLLVFGQDLQGMMEFFPLEGWEQVGPDAIHLNDFVMTPYGLVASCFNYRPYRVVNVPGAAWQKGGYGLLLSLEKRQGRNVGRVVGAGLDCPHSLVWHTDRLYCCASATGEFVRLAPQVRGERVQFVEEERILISEHHFLRGALPLDDGRWVLGGSSARRTENARGMALFVLQPDGGTQRLDLGAVGEIYDILPWQQDIMLPVAACLRALPPDLAEEGLKYPPPCEAPEY